GGRIRDPGAPRRAQRCRRSGLRPPAGHARLDSLARSLAQTDVIETRDAATLGVLGCGVRRLDAVRDRLRADLPAAALAVHADDGRDGMVRMGGVHAVNRLVVPAAAHLAITLVASDR